MDRSVFEHISVEAFGCIFKWNALGCIPVEYFLACSCGMLSGIVELNAFGYWNGFGHIPVECFRSYYNEMLSRKFLGVFQWITFGRIPVECFWSLPVECFRALERRTGESQWNADRFDLLAGSLKFLNFDDCFKNFIKLCLWSNPCPFLGNFCTDLRC